MDAFLQESDVINWRHPSILRLAQHLAASDTADEEIARTCFEWVRDRIYHSVDYQMNPVPWKASDVLHHSTGYCFAKSHLLAALLRANGIPAGFCYQRLSLDDRGAPYSLHGFNAVYLSDCGWYRIDPRGNRADINAQFTPPHEQLAYTPSLAGETDFPAILPAPLPLVVKALQSHDTWDALLRHLPDLFLNSTEVERLTASSPAEILHNE